MPMAAARSLLELIVAVLTIVSFRPAPRLVLAGGEEFGGENDQANDHEGRDNEENDQFVGVGDQGVHRFILCRHRRMRRRHNDDFPETGSSAPGLDKKMPRGAEGGSRPWQRISRPQVLLASTSWTCSYRTIFSGASGCGCSGEKSAWRSCCALPARSWIDTRWRSCR